MSTSIEELQLKFDILSAKVQIMLKRGVKLHYKFEDLSNSIDVLQGDISHDLLKLDEKVINLKINVSKEEFVTRYICLLCSVVTIGACYLITKKM